MYFFIVYCYLTKFFLKKNHKPHNNAIITRIFAAVPVSGNLTIFLATSSIFHVCVTTHVLVNDETGIVFSSVTACSKSAGVTKSYKSSDNFISFHVASFNDTIITI
jgi:hypothetical protein